MLSIKEISEKTGYSTATVSRALDPRYYNKVKPAARERIMALCDKYQYRPKFSARALASGKTYTIGMISPDVESTVNSPTFSQFISGLSHELGKSNYTMSILPVVSDDLEEIDRQIAQIFYTSRVDGFVLASMIAGKLTLQELAKHKFPVVAFSMPSDPVPELPVTSIYVDNDKAYTELFSHLKKQGRHKAAFIGMGDTCLFRMEQCLENMKSVFDLKPSDIYLLPRKSMRGEQALNTYLAVRENWDHLKHYDTWIMSNDFMARGAYFFLRDMGYEPGGKIAIAGYDNIEESRPFMLEEPVLTTINPRLNLLASDCVELLMEQIKGPCDVRRHSLASQLIIRKSSNPNKGE